MTPEQVPDELAELLGQKLYDEQSEGCAAPGCQGHPGPVECRNWARDLLAAVLPAHEAMVEQAVLHQTADDYDAYLLGGGDPNCPVMWLRGRAARIALGERP